MGHASDASRKLRSLGPFGQLSLHFGQVRAIDQTRADVNELAGGNGGAVAAGQLVEPGGGEVAHFEGLLDDGDIDGSVFDRVEGVWLIVEADGEHFSLFSGGAERVGDDRAVIQPDPAQERDVGPGNQDVVDLSMSGYATFVALQAAGALTQVNADVVITLNPLDPTTSDKITLKTVNLSTLDATDFKFV